MYEQEDNVIENENNVIENENDESSYLMMD